MVHKENDEGAHLRSPIESPALILPPRDPQTPGPGHRGPKPCPWFRGRAERVGMLRNVATTGMGTAQHHPAGCAQDGVVANPELPALLC